MIQEEEEGVSVSVVQEGVTIQKRVFVFVVYERVMIQG